MSAISCQQALRVPTVADSQISVPPVRKPTISSISQSFGGWDDGQRYDNCDLLEGLRDLHYEGPINNGQPEGNGIKIFTDGSRYEGGFVSGKMEGRGVIDLTRWGHYEGGFSKNRMEGFGTLENRCVKFVGRFFQGRKDGQGWQLDKETRTIYEGEFRKGERDGLGTLILPSGAIYRGVFENDGIVGSGILEYNGCQYQLDFSTP